jgi:hypothetical protein
MDATESGNHQDDPSRDVHQSPSAVERPRPAINNPTGESGTAKQKTNWPQRIEAVCAVMLVIITGTYTYYAAGQLHKMKRSTDAAEKAANAAASAADTADKTLKEIRAGGTDTHDLALAAKAQATASREIAKRTTDQIQQLKESVKQASALVTTSKDTLATTQSNFIKDQRPYVWPSAFRIVMEEVGKPIEISVWFINYGKTPAIKQRSASKVFVYFGKEDTLSQADNFFASLDRDQLSRGTGSEIIIPPGIPSDPDKSPIFITASSGDMFIGDQVTLDKINQTTDSFLVAGSAVYEDSAGNRYWSDFCGRHLSTGAIAACPRHNEIH